MFNPSTLTKSYDDRYQYLQSDKTFDENPFSFEYNIDDIYLRTGGKFRKSNDKNSNENLSRGFWDSISEWMGLSYDPPTPSIPSRPIPEIIYLEILIIIDYQLYNSFNNLEQLINYLYTFWDNVDNLYASLYSPQVKLSIAGVIIPTDPNVFEFLEPESTGLFNWAGGLDYENARRSMNSWLYKYKNTFPDDSYDLFMIMTSSVYNSIFSSTIGQATVAGACRKSDNSQTLNRGGIIYINPKLNNVITAAHEIGHLLGIYHDDELGCSNDYIMSAINEKYNTKWSSCSQEALRQFLRDYNPMCLYNKPDTFDV
ncbi:A disintegrin and metalloproteinase with thrombospondin motifs like isoform X2 [Microplitis mediator]|uniref:A disintegrin and metalloproteinase with thrombospondin motifs like isoform X2 n=1 Tax=Microplitis mediator TaxID=375433 RepID=UPI002555F457|nr:A disintegrin and metalloproteinase with thrombospondin motifs like isoform X2 [Microplitis mediator]